MVLTKASYVAQSVFSSLSSFLVVVQVASVYYKNLCCASLIRGACGEVRLAFTRGSCEKFAVKIICKKKFSVGVSLSVETFLQCKT